MVDKKSDSMHIIPIEDWLLLIIVSLIPGINLIVMGIMSFNKNNNPNKRNFSRAAFGFIVVLYLLIVAGFFI